MSNSKIITLCLFFLVSTVEATNVQWRYRDALIDHYTYSSPDYPGFGVSIWMPTGMCIDLFVSLEMYDYIFPYRQFHLTFDGQKSQNVPQNIIAAEYGDIAGSSTLRNLKDGQYLVHNYVDDGERSKGPVTINVDESSPHYLAFVVVDDWSSTSPDVVYGWVSYEIYQLYDGEFHDEFRILDYAYDLDGGPMIVGGGAYSIPEPSGGLLLVLGAAALGLRRRIGRGDCPRFGSFGISRR